MDNPTPQKSTLPTWVKPVAVVGVIGVIAAIISPFLSASLAPVDDGPKLTHTIRRGDLSVTVTENGTVESSNNKEIKCLVKGGSTVLWVIETGTMVKPGDELVKLDTSTIEENITRQTILVERAVANEIIEQANVEVAKTNIEEYLYGTYLEERATIEKDIFDAEEQVKKTQLAYGSAQRMASKGILRSLQLDGEKFAVDSARKALELKQTTAEDAGELQEEKVVAGIASRPRGRRGATGCGIGDREIGKGSAGREEEQLKNCIITADTEGMVIFPSAAEWKETPDIEEGAVVREQQTLLMIPDVSKMQVKVGIHESKVDQLKIGMPATVQLQDLTLEGAVSEIATVTRPAGWWTGNMVKYDTLIKLQQRPGLKPGMSAVVDVVLEKYEDELLIPVAAILEGDDGYVCWVKAVKGIQRRAIDLGGSNDEFTVVKSGLAAGDEVVLNPLAFIDEAQKAALRPAGSFRKPDTAGGRSKLAKSQLPSRPRVRPETNRQSKPSRRRPRLPARCS